MTGSGAPTTASSESALRDALALDRTRLSNERTFLAYIRTALAFFIAGAGLLHFLFESTPALVLGWMLCGLGAVTILVGGWRFLEVRRRIRDMVAAHARLTGGEEASRRTAS